MKERKRSSAQEYYSAIRLGAGSTIKINSPHFSLRENFETHPIPCNYLAGSKKKAAHTHKKYLGKLLHGEGEKKREK